MIRFERTRDYARIAAILTHPRIWPGISDDGSPAPEDFRPLESEALLYLLAFDGDELVGLFLAREFMRAVWDVHPCLLPSCWGPRALAAGQAFVDWMWTNTPARKLVGFTPAPNTLALRYAKRCGMSEAGRLTRCYQRAGELEDLIIFEQSKGARSESASAQR